MGDVVIGALNRKRPRSSGAKGGHNKEAPPEKRVNTVGKTSYLKTLPPPPSKAGEASRAVGDTGPTSSPPPTRSKPHPLDDRP